MMLFIALTAMEPPLLPTFVAAFTTLSTAFSVLLSWLANTAELKAGIAGGFGGQASEFVLREIGRAHV